MLHDTSFLKDFECYFLKENDTNYKKANISEDKLREFKHIQILKTKLDKYIKNKYYNNGSFNKLSDDEYLTMFKQFLVDAIDPQEAMFMLPQGELKKVKIDLTDFDLNCVFSDKYGITKDNLYSKLNIDHQQIEYLGFDLNRLFKIGCIRISCNRIFDELAIEMDLHTHKPSRKCIDILENLCLSYTKISVDFTKEYHRLYTNSAFDIKKDIYSLYKTLH